MREHLTVVTRKGQITIPAAIRRALDLKQGDQIAVVQEGNEARLARRGSAIGRTKGALKSAVPPLSPEELREQTERAIAEDVAERMGG
jgi:AbrB family looped-hinge helix DNA binding protein